MTKLRGTYRTPYMAQLTRAAKAAGLSRAAWVEKQIAVALKLPWRKPRPVGRPRLQKRRRNVAEK